MAIEKKLVCFKTQANFDTQLAAGNIMDYSIVFIKDTQRIWTHGVYFTSLKELFEKLNTKQNALTASANITITESDGRLLIAAKDTTYTLSLVGDLLTLKDSADTVVSTIDLSKYVYTLPQATPEILGGVKIVDTVGEEGIKTDAITLQTIPSNGKKGQLLSHDGTKGVWVDYDMLDMISYGVKWKPNVADPHLERCGNINMHKTLPIQSGMKGCVYNSLNKAVVYWLDEANWNFRKNPTILKGIDLSTDNTVIPVADTTTFVVGQYIRVSGSEDIAVITEITENTSITVAWQGEAAPAETVDIEIGSRLDGYDGEVMVFVPEFWIKSWDEANNREVRISTMAVDESWTHQPSVFIGAYRDTVLNTVPENMGYLSTLEVNTAISVANSNAYCRGGNNNPANDALEDIFRRQLGKCRTDISRATFRGYTRKAGKEILSYRQYRNIMYWLWVIEYANLNSQDTYKPDLTAEGFHQGGLGAGLTTMGNWGEYNGYCPISPNGYTNEFGNGTASKSLVIPEFTYGAGSTVRPAQTLQATRWRGIENPFGDVWHNVDGIIIDADADNHPNNMNYVYTTDDPALYGDAKADMEKMELTGLEIHQDGYTKEWDLGDSANIIPRVMGGSTTQYKCDYHWTGSKNTALRTLLLGGSANSGADAGLGSFYSDYGVGSVSATVGFRSIISIG